MGIGDFIEERRDQILALWLDRARGLPSARGLTHEELSDALPGFLLALAALLRDDKWSVMEKAIHLHVSSRFRQGFGVEELVNEISLIGPCVFQDWVACHSGKHPPSPEVALVFEALHHTAARSVSWLTRHLIEDEQTEKKYSRLLDRVATESFAEGARPVAERFEEIMRVIFEAMEGDAAWLAIHVSGTDTLVVQASSGALSSRIRGSSAQIGAGTLEGEVANSEAPLILKDLEQSPLHLSGAVIQSDLRSVIGSRVWSGNELRGVLLVGSNAIDQFGARHAWRIETFAGRLALLLDHARMWETLRQQNALLGQNEERLRLAAYAAEIGIWEFIPATRTLIWDARSREMWGLPADAVITYEVYFSGIHPDDRARIEAAVTRAVESSTPFHEEYRVVGNSDGVERWISTLGKPLVDESGQAGRFLGVMRDITEAKRIEELRERLFGIVGHDLRNPLSAISMAALSLAPQAAPKELRLVRIISRCADRMNRMIHDLLDFTRVRFAAGVALDPQPVDLAALCRDILNEIELASPKRELKLSASGDCAGVWDPSRLSEALSNLIGNAIQHGAEGTPVEIKVAGDAEDLTLEVHNEGPPIPEEIAQRMFDPFRRGGVAAGLGLGLFITREIVVAHGGRIDVHSSGEGGTTFVVRLPRVSTGHEAAAAVH